MQKTYSQTREGERGGEKEEMICCCKELDEKGKIKREGEMERKNTLVP